MDKLNLNLNAAAASSTPSTENSNALRVAEILRCQRRLFAAYRTDQYSDPEGFMASLGMVFSQYPIEVAQFVTDPRTGVQRRSVFPPTIAEVVSACDEFVQMEAKRRRFENWGKNDPDLAQERIAYQRASLGSGEASERPSLEALHAKYGKDYGLGDGRLNETAEQTNERWRAQVKPISDVLKFYQDNPGRIVELANAGPKMRGEM